jgi:hypothetical protein
MRVRVSSLAVVLLVPSIALAQRGGMGGMGGGGRRGGGMGGERGREAEPPKFPEAKDLQKYNPASLLIDKKKKLSLADSQVVPLKALEAKIYERNAALLVRYDSLRSAYHPPSRSSGDAPAPGADSTRSVAMTQMRGMRELLDSLSERRRVDVHDALDLIADEKTKKKAAEFVDDQDKKFNDLIPQLPGGGSGRRGRSLSDSAAPTAPPTPRVLPRSSGGQ